MIVQEKAEEPISNSTKRATVEELLFDHEVQIGIMSFCPFRVRLIFSFVRPSNLTILVGL